MIKDIKKMKQKIIIDNRTEEPTPRLLKYAGSFIQENKTKCYIDSQSKKQIYCSLIKNDCSKRILFTYQKVIQKQLF